MRSTTPSLLLLAAAAACSRNVVSDETPSLRAESPTALATQVVAETGRAEATAPDEFPLVPAHEPYVPSIPAAQSPDSSAPPLTLSGTITIAPELASKVAPSDVLYVVARPASGGPPVGLRRISPVKLPAAFTLTSADNPMASMGGGPIAGKLMVRAKVDKDGDAMTNAAGDLEGIVKEVEAGAEVTIVIDHEIEGE